MMSQQAYKQQGFTLVELVTVIVILGVLSAGISKFITFGTQTYSDAADREELLSSARFAIERLNREVRNALPNSVRVTSNASKQCLEFTPIAQSVIYLDAPVAPEVASSTINLVPFTNTLAADVTQVSIYALNSDDIYNAVNGVVANFDSVTASAGAGIPAILNLSAATLFNDDSPTQRLYFIESAVAFCLEGGQLYRYQDYSHNPDKTPKSDGSRVLMTDYLVNDLTDVPFKTLPASLQRNAVALIKLKFRRNLEDIVFNNEIQVPNVP